MTDTLAVIGGSGNLGAALARRWAKAGCRVVIGSRDPAKAVHAERELADPRRGRDLGEVPAAPGRILCGGKLA